MRQEIFNERVFGGNLFWEMGVGGSAFMASGWISKAYPRIVI